MQLGGSLQPLQKPDTCLVLSQINSFYVLLKDFILQVRGNIFPPPLQMIFPVVLWRKIPSRGLGISPSLGPHFLILSTSLHADQILKEIILNSQHISKIADFYNRKRLHCRRVAWVESRCTGNCSVVTRYTPITILRQPLQCALITGAVNYATLFQ